MTLSVVGLIAFVVVVGVDVLVLLYDLWRVLTGRRSITSYVRANLLWTIPLTAWQLAGAAGLNVHFYC